MTIVPAIVTALTPVQTTMFRATTKGRRQLPERAGASESKMHLV